MDGNIKMVLIAASAVAVSGCVTHLGSITPGTMRVIAGSEIPVSDRSTMLNRKDDEAWMLLTFSSDDNYLDVAQRKQMHVVVNESLCDAGRTVRDIMSSTILAGLPSASRGSDTSGASATPKRYVYRTYFAMTSRKRVAEGADPGPAAGYDLRSETYDLCIQIKGGNMVGMTVQSGIAVFPRASVEAAVGLSRPSQ